MRHQNNLGYFETKRRAEAIVRKAVNENGLNAVIICPSTVYGPGDAKKGSRKIQVKVARGEFKFYTSGGVSVVHVRGVVSTLIAALELGKSGERYILAGENITIKKLFEIISEFAQVEAPRFYLPNFLLYGLGVTGDLMNRIGAKGPLTKENAVTSTLFHWFDATKAKDVLGFKPGSARDAIEDSVLWMKQNGLLLK
jgi:dihydroflavonol-4-reductase